MTYAKGVIAAACLAASLGMAKAQSLGFVNLSAAISAGGVVNFSSGVSAASRVSTGVYAITFTRDISKCEIVATPRGTVGGQISIAQPAAPSQVIHIYTFSKTGAAVNVNFSVVVSCNSGT